MAVEQVLEELIYDAYANNGKSILEYSWCIWEHTDDQKDYNANINKICTFDTVEDFWLWFLRIPSPSQFFTAPRLQREKVGNRSVVSYSIFREGIEPKWEDPIAKKGGEWRIRRFRNVDEVSFIWTEIVLALIGGTLEPNDKILGIRVVDSSHTNKYLYNIEIWSSDMESLNEIKRLITHTVPTVEPSKMYLRSHS